MRSWRCLWKLLFETEIPRLTSLKVVVDRSCHSTEFRVMQASGDPHSRTSKHPNISNYSNTSELNSTNQSSNTDVGAALALTIHVYKQTKDDYTDYITK